MNVDADDALTQRYIAYTEERERLIRRISSESTVGEKRKHNCAQRLKDLDRRIIPNLQAKMSRTDGIETI